MMFFLSLSPAFPSGPGAEAVKAAEGARAAGRSGAESLDGLKSGPTSDRAIANVGVAPSRKGLIRRVATTVVSPAFCWGDGSSSWP